MMVAGVAGAAVLSLAGVARAQVKDSAHDLTAESWQVEGSRTLCGPCHTPHNAGDQDGNQLIPLWNHMTDKDSTFTPYTSDSLDASVGDPTGPSLACLSCHDGAIAIDSYGKDLVSGLMITGTHYMTDPDRSPLANLGTDLSNDHPISFDYDAAQALDGYLRASDTEITDVPAFAGKTIGEALLKGGKMECTSCHDPHRQKGTNGENPSSLFLVIDGPGYDGSMLCLECHIK